MSPERAKIMVVDDNRIDLDAAKMALELGGHEVTPIQLPRLAPTLAKRLQPDLLLLDVLMDQMSGDELVPVVRERLKHQKSSADSPIILLYSVKDETELEALVLRSGADGYIQKSGKPGHLLREVNGWLRRARDGKKSTKAKKPE